MSDSPIPAGAGLATDGRPEGDPGEPRHGSDLIDAAADGDTLTPQESDDLLAYYLSNEELPGGDDEVPLEVTLGRGDSARTFKCVVKPIDWAAWQDARERATNQQTGEFDTFVSSSWVVARALVTPRLGPTVNAQQNEAKAADDGKIAWRGERIDPPTDGAVLLRRMFKKQSGSLLELSAKVLELSKLNDASGRSVKEVEAGKT